MSDDTEKKVYDGMCVIESVLGISDKETQKWIDAANRDFVVSHVNGKWLLAEQETTK